MNKMLSNISRTKTAPVAVTRSVRPNSQRVLTSFEPGKMVPVMAVPLLREDSIAGAAYRITFEMKETVEVLMNSVNARVMVYLVPKTALARFNGLDEINRSYEKKPPMEGQPVVPWFETMTAPAIGTNEIFKKMGLHPVVGKTINTEYIECYNAIWNFRARNRSPDIELRERLDSTLAPAFWTHENFAHIVPDFDSAAMDGAVPLSISNARLPISGLGVFAGDRTPSAGVNVREGDGAKTYEYGYRVVDGNATVNASETSLRVRAKSGALGALPDIFAELQDDGITVSLANIEMAKKTQAFAELRKQYSGHTDDYIIDLLMDGIAVPEQAWNQPILLADTSTVFGMSKRYATDADNLTESVVNGLTMVETRFRCPAVNMGGVVMMVVEITPEQLFERQSDPYLDSIDVDTLPQYVRDVLDPEKVDIVKNYELDSSHGTPDATFGYSPLNARWAKSVPRVGGKFFRPAVNTAFDEDRQRIWAVETANLTLSKDFYLCTTMHQKPFKMTTGDNFEVLIRGEAAIRGLTVFGKMLVEANGDYEAIEEEQPRERIDKEATP